MLGLILGSLISLLSDMILSYKFGADAFTDAFFIAQSVPFILYLALAVAITGSLTIIYKSLKRDETINSFASNILTIVFMLALLVIIVISFVAKPVVYIFAVGFDEETLSVAVKLTRIIIYSLIPLSMISVFKGFLQYKKKFVSIAFESVPIYLCLFFGILSSSTEKYNILGISIFIGYLITAMIMVVSSYKNGMRYKPHFKLNDENIKPLMILVIPIFINLFSYQINNFIDRTLASTIATGAISSLFYSQKLLMILIGILFFIVSSVFFPMLVKSYQKTKMRDFKEILFYSLNSVAVIILPLSIFLITLANPIITIIFQRGAFNVENTKLTADVFMMYSIGMLPLTLKLMLDNIFYSMNDKKTPLIGAVILVAVNILLDYVLIQPLQTMGIALATSIASAISVIIMVFMLRNKIGKYKLKTIGANILKIIFAGIPISLGVLILFTMIYYSMKSSLANIVICLLIMSIIFKLCYKILLKIFKVDGLNYNVIFKEEIKAAFFKRYIRKYTSENFEYQPIAIPIAGLENYFQIPTNLNEDEEETEKLFYNETIETSISDDGNVERLRSKEKTNDAKHLTEYHHRDKKVVLNQYKISRYRLKKYTSKKKIISKKGNKTNNNLNTKVDKKSRQTKLQYIRDLKVHILKYHKGLNSLIIKISNKIFSKNFKKRVNKFLSMPTEDKFDNED
jgi:putative peptidoglycan lipid II flippase